MVGEECRAALGPSASFVLCRNLNTHTSLKQRAIFRPCSSLAHNSEGRSVAREKPVAQLQIVYWRDIPAQVMVKAGRRNQAKRELSLRFTEAIDMAAMRTGAAETDDYLAEWRRGDPQPVGDDLEAEADKAVAQIEQDYDKGRLVALVNNGGHNP